jgi:hypothetical protein
VVCLGSKGTQESKVVNFIPFFLAIKIILEKYFMDFFSYYSSIYYFICFKKKIKERIITQRDPRKMDLDNKSTMLYNLAFLNILYSTKICREVLRFSIFLFFYFF